jgi:hypothetical protein
MKWQIAAEVIEKPQCRVSTPGDITASNLPVKRFGASAIARVDPTGISSTNDPVTANGRSQDSALGRSPNPLPKNTPG